MTGWEAAVKGVDFEEDQSGRPTKLTDDEVAYDTATKTAKVYRTRIIVRTAFAEDSTSLAGIPGKSLIVTGVKKDDVRMFTGEEVELSGVVKGFSSIEVTSLRETHLVGETAWKVGILSAKTERILTGAIGGTRMLYPASTEGGDSFLLVTLQLTELKTPAVLPFRQRATYVQDEQGQKFPFKGKFNDKGDYDPYVVSWNCFASSTIRLAFPIKGAPGRYTLTLADGFSPIGLPEVKAAKK